MSDTLAPIKNVQVIRALQLIALGQSQTEACRLAGISVSTLNRRLDENPNLAQEFQIVEKGRLQNLYEDLGQAHERIVIDLIETAKDPDLKVSEKLAIEFRLRELRGNIEQQLNMVPSSQNPEDNKDLAKDFLSSRNGPRLKKATSVTTTLEFEDDAQTDIIDISPS